MPSLRATLILLPLVAGTAGCLDQEHRLLAELRADDETTVAGAAYTIGRRRHASDEQTRVLHHVSAHGSALELRHAIWALGELPQRRDRRKALLELLLHEKILVRATAAWTLARRYASDRVAAGLRNLLDDESEIVRMMARSGLARIASRD